ncbi:flagellar hook capping FlgD N-terminal domain-containing protein [Roseobacter sp.]|uniref:flagellar hook capping FlgD N-terminal domain-containing protein n=1 Tax=Roseobacter sp. TaxID=1907202 RepID=UPI0038589F96
MEITNSQASQSVDRTASATAQTSAVLSSDFETFLQMLTAQAKYQDPLEPIDSSEYAAQLAQFSMVEQQVLSNELLEALTSQVGAGNIGETASWIGMEARTMAAAQFDGKPVTVAPKIEAGADQAFLVAYNAIGEEVQRKEISTSDSSVEWSGVGDDGAPLPFGLYTFKVESRSLGQTVGTSPVESYTRITETRRQDDATVLVLQGGVTVKADEVTALREAL